jgi:NADPH:quinone reductase-like Zn-dependent oxidoreductase
VIINGASGSLGTAAVQIAKHFETHVTGVCSTANVELVRSLGADRVVDYTKEDFTQSDERYDVILDVVRESSFGRCKGSLSDGGIYLSTILRLPILIQMLMTSLFGDKKARFSATGLRSVPDRLGFLKEVLQLVEKKKIRSVIDRTYPLEQMVEAHRFVEAGHKKGNVVVTVTGGR